MPTYRNSSRQIINYEAGGKIYNFPPGEETGTTIYVPYKELGLELIDEQYPPLKSPVLMSGKFRFAKGMERIIRVPHCGRYKLRVSVTAGKLRMYLGGSGLGIEITGEYDSVNDWIYAPYVKFLGLEDSTEAVLYGTAVEP